MHLAAAGFDDEQAVQAPEGEGTVAAWAFKNLRQLRSVAVSVPEGSAGFEDAADRGCADVVSEFEQLALNPFASPAVVFDGEPVDERGDLSADGWPSCSL
jgi:hypothetical protein